LPVASPSILATAAATLLRLGFSGVLPDGVAVDAGVDPVMLVELLVWMELGTVNDPDNLTVGLDTRKFEFP